MGDKASRLLVDLAAGRPVTLDTPVDDDFLSLAHRHGLLGLVGGYSDPRLNKAAFPELVRWTARQEVMKAHLRRLLESFAVASIPIAPLKGPFLAHSAYQNPRLRLFTDLDVLVRREDLDRALEVIAEDVAVHSIPRKRPTADKREVPLFDARTGISFNLDVHWDLFSYTQLHGCARGATAEAWTSSTGPVWTELGPHWLLPDPVRIAFLCTHAALDHRFRLILFRDLAEIARGDVDWDELARFAQRWHLRSFVYLSLLIAARVLEAPIPAQTLSQIRPSQLAIRAIEALLPRTDLVHFDGHRPHLLNLAIVLLHDEPLRRLQLLVKAPAAFPEWRRRVEPRDATRPTPSPSIAVVVASDRRRGAEVFGERLRDGLRARGWDAELNALSSQPQGRRVAASAVSRRVPGEVGRVDMDVIRGLREHFRQRRPQVVLANGSATLQYCLAALVGIRPRPLFAYASIGEPRYWLRGPLRRIAQRLMLSRVDLVFAVSAMTRDQLTDDLGVPHEKVIVAHTGVPESFFVIEPEPRQGRFRLLFVGNLSEEKGPQVALEVYERLEAAVPSQLRFVGAGPLLGALEHRVTSQGRGQVEFTGAVEDVRPHLAWADALILCSETEGLPGAVLEAGAAAVPTVAFDVGGTAETIEDGVTGVLIPYGDVEGMVEVLLRWAADEDARRRMGEQARNWVRERFTLDQAAERYHQVLVRSL